MTFITQEYDFFDAIIKKMNLASKKYNGFAIDKVIPILDNASIVKTTHGNFHCESFEDNNKNIYMKVTTFI